MIPTYNMLRRRLKLRDLEVLVALDDTRAVNRAAEALHTSQPAVSRTLAQIEQALEAQLFERTAKGVVPTAIGARLIGYARHCLETLDRAAQDLSVIKQGGLGHVAVGTNYSSAATLLPRALLRLQRRYPGVRVSVREAALDALLRDLLSNRIDLAIARLGPEAHDDIFHTELLADEPLCLICGPQHPLVEKPNVGWADLLEYRWILPVAGAPIRHRLGELLRAENQPWPQSQVESSSVLLNTTLLRTSDVISIVPTAVAEHQIQLGLVHRIQFELPEVFAPMGLIFLRDTPLSEATSLVVACIREEVALLRGSPKD